MRPIVIAGMDHSGTSLLAGMLHHAGIAMGDVETCAEVLTNGRPEQYLTYEDRALLPAAQQYALTRDTATFVAAVEDYIRVREAQADGRPWGVKHNALLFVYGRLETPVQWVTTYRPLGTVVRSTLAKWRAHLPAALLKGLLCDQHAAYLAMRETLPPSNIFLYEYAMRQGTGYLAHFTAPLLGEVTPAHLDAMAQIMDPVRKGVVTCRG